MDLGEEDMQQLVRTMKKRFSSLFQSSTEKTKYNRSQLYREFQLSLRPFILSRSYIKPDTSHVEFIEKAYTNVGRSLWNCPTCLSEDTEAYEKIIVDGVKRAWDDTRYIYFVGSGDNGNGKCAEDDEAGDAAEGHDGGEAGKGGEVGKGGGDDGDDGDDGDEGSEGGGDDGGEGGDDVGKDGGDDGGEGGGDDGGGEVEDNLVLDDEYVEDGGADVGDIVNLDISRYEGDNFDTLEDIVEYSTGGDEGEEDCNEEEEDFNEEEEEEDDKEIDVQNGAGDEGDDVRVLKISGDDDACILDDLMFQTVPLTHNTKDNEHIIKEDITSYEPPVTSISTLIEYLPMNNTTSPEPPVTSTSTLIESLPINNTTSSDPPVTSTSTLIESLPMNNTTSSEPPVTSISTLIEPLTANDKTSYEPPLSTIPTTTAIMNKNNNEKPLTTNKTTWLKHYLLKRKVYNNEI